MPDDPNIKKVSDYCCGVIPVMKPETNMQKYLFLMVQMVKGDHWAFPKGHPEEGETEIETAQRELEEETGITRVSIQEDAKFTESYFYMQDGALVNKVVDLFIGFTTQQHPVIQELEVKAYKWVNYKEALALATYPASKKTIREAKKYLDKKLSSDYDQDM